MVSQQDRELFSVDDELDLYFLGPFEGCLEDPTFRASTVHFLITQCRFEQAIEMAIPLIGTDEDAWFLFACAWGALAEGQTDRAVELYAQAEDLASAHNWFNFRASFVFDDEGAPRPVFPFLSPLDFPDAHEPFLFEGTLVAEVAELLRMGDWPKTLMLHRQARAESQQLVSDLSFWIEQILHLDFQCARTALKGMSLFTVERDDALRYLTLLFSCDEYLESALEVFWRLNAEWGFSVPAGEVVTYLYYLLSRDDQALEFANRCLDRDQGSVVAGNIKGLLLTERGQWYAADEQWRRTLRASPNRGATYLVLGWQALNYQSEDIALRYFLEAAHIGDNPFAAAKSLELSYKLLPGSPRSSL